jgi:hypothetical protein
MEEGEELTLIADGDGDGWVRAQNSKGETGFIPENYIQLNQDQTNGYGADPNEMNVDGDPPSSAGYESSSLPPSSAGYDSGSLSSAPHSAGLPTEPASGYSPADYEVQQVVISHEAPTPTEPGVWVKALYDYDATCEEELSFVEGQMIRVLRKDVNGVDDGWWEGEVDGRTGVFPSLVVEELSENGDISGDATPIPSNPSGTNLEPENPLCNHGNAIVSV